MDTAELWTEFTIVCLEWGAKDPRGSQQALELLKLGLERSQESLLHVKIVHYASPTLAEEAAQALSMLGATCHRWRTASLTCPGPTIPAFGFHRQLAGLKSLEIKDRRHGKDRWTIDTFSVFRDAPKSRAVAFSGETSLQQLPLEQLEHVLYKDVVPSTLHLALDCLPRLSGAAYISLAADFDRHTNINFHSSSEITKFWASVDTHYFDSDELHACVKLLNVLLSSITLGSLRELVLKCTGYPTAVVPWPDATIRALAGRSHFNAHLHTLDVRHMFLSELELLSALTELPRLQTLAFSDQLALRDSEPTTTILTDELMSRLTETVFPKELLTDTLTSNRVTHILVPDLHTFSCATQLSFDHQKFFEFVESRSGRERVECFEVQLSWWPKQDGSQPCLEPQVESKLWQLHKQHRSNLKLRIGRDPSSFRNRYGQWEPVGSMHI
ncbi:hypothetical protein MIND_00671400 [Mycena indigotica]|uniref:Uncharacterized protein n=1 Tax=Mycena indigotica TaxID=2126181 RepID=A0A8H6W6H4_9AGAR|nr:uncharacterized protein MIND_00671400 [Mycena indigotica]KAF7301074.1 hypothetical protein MIND_00671400 [Mycena indigotica]